MYPVGRREAALAALIGAVIIAGCGGGDSDGPRSDQPASAPAGETDLSEPQAREQPAGQTSARKKASARRKAARERRRARPRRGRRAAPRDERESRPAPREEEPRTNRETERPAGPTKQSFIRAPDRICRDFGRRDTRLRRRASNTLRGQATYYRRLADVVQDTADRLGALEVPEGGDRTISRYVGYVEENAPLLQELSRALRREDVEEVDLVSRKIRANGLRANRLAKRYGFRVCGGQSQD